MKIGIIDYQMGNIASLRNSFDKIGHHAEIITDPEGLKACDKLILPGVGAFHDAAQHLSAEGMDEAIQTYVKSGKALLGVCLGMQLLMESSEESRGAKGLGLISGDVVHFKNHEACKGLKVPHMGWNRMDVDHEDPLFRGLGEHFYLYFVHAYHVQCDCTHVLGRSDYGVSFTSAVRHENVYGLQPHPEKSHENGLKILKNFVEIQQ